MLTMCELLPPMASIHDVRMMGQRGADKREMLLGNSMFGRLLARRWRAACVLAPTLPWKIMMMVVVMTMINDDARSFKKYKLPVIQIFDKAALLSK